MNSKKKDKLLILLVMLPVIVLEFAVSRIPPDPGLVAFTSGYQSAS